MQCADKGAHAVGAGGNFPCPARSGQKHWNLWRGFETVFNCLLHIAARFGPADNNDDFGITVFNRVAHNWNLHAPRSEEHTSELQSRGHLVCRLLLEKKTAR